MVFRLIVFVKHLWILGFSINNLMVRFRCTAAFLETRSVAGNFPDGDPIRD